MLRKIVSIIFLLLILANMPSSHPMGIVTPLQEDEKPKLPIMFAAKTTDRKEIYRGDWFTIKIIVSNLGNDTAYNITIYDSKYPQWNIELDGYQETYIVPSMEPNTTIIIEYKARILVAAQQNFSLGIVKLEYYDSEGNKHKVISEELVITVKEKYYIEKSMIYRNFIIALTVLIVPIIVALILIERKVALEYQKRK